MNRLDRENGEKVCGRQLATFEENANAAFAFWGEVAQVRDFDGLKAALPKGAQVARENVDRAVSTGQEVFGRTLKATKPSPRSPRPRSSRPPPRSRPRPRKPSRVPPRPRASNQLHRPGNRPRGLSPASKPGNASCRVFLCVRRSYGGGGDSTISTNACSAGPRGRLANSRR